MKMNNWFYWMHRGLEPFAQEISKYKTYKSILPKGFAPSDVIEMRVFGPSLRNRKYHDIDLAIFVRPEHPVFVREGTDALLGEYEVGKFHFTVIADTPVNRDLFWDLAKVEYTGKGYVFIRVDPRYFFNQGSQVQSKFTNDADRQI